jgi:hypothetical protein
MRRLVVLSYLFALPLTTCSAAEPRRRSCTPMRTLQGKPALVRRCCQG